MLFGISISVAQNSSGEISYALKLYNQKFYDLSARQFIKYYNQYPGNNNVDEARYYAGMSLYNLGEYHNARVEFQGLALEFPASKRAPESWFKIADCYTHLNKPIDAAKAYETIKNIYPNNDLAPEALLQAGRIYAEQKETEKAQNLFLVISDRYPGSKAFPSALIELARFYMGKNAFFQAINTAEKALQSDAPDSVKARATFLLGEINQKRGFLAAAQIKFTGVIHSYPKTKFSQKAALRLGQIALSKNDYKQALNYFGKAGALSGSRLDEAKGDAYFLAGNFKKAGDRYSQAAKTENDASLFLPLKQAITQKKLGEHNKALNFLELALQKNSSDSYNLDKIYIDYLNDLNKYAQAATYIKTLLVAEKNTSRRFELTNLLDAIYLKTSSYDNLIRSSAPLVNEHNRSQFVDDIYYKLANAYEANKQYGQAAQTYQNLLVNFASSAFYGAASEKLAILNDYFIINRDRAIRTQGALLSRMISGASKNSLFLDLGRMYYEDLKDYNEARHQFELAVVGKGTQLGDAYLLWGKSLKKEAQTPGLLESDKKKLLTQAAEKFKSAVENSATVTQPDQAAWDLVLSRIETDTITVEKEKSYVQRLIKKYPDSPLQETWNKTLAFTLAFSDSLTNNALDYFKYLIQNSKQSKNYPQYLFNYAQLIVESEPETALGLYKDIVFKFPNSPQAAKALFNIAGYYEEQGNYSNAAQLYTRLQNEYYYSDQAGIAKEKIGGLLEQAGQFALAVEMLKPQVDSPYMQDVVLSQSLVPSETKDNLFYLARAYHGLKADSTAILNYRRYLRIAPDGRFRDAASFQLAEIYYSHRAYDQALDQLKNVSSNDTSLSKRATIYKADIYYEQGTYDAALPIYKKLIALTNPRDKQSEWFSKYVMCTIRVGKVKESEKEIALFKRKFPKDDESLARFNIELGNYYRINKNFNRAIRFFKKVKSKYDDTQSVDDAVYYLALTDITLNKHEEALDILTSFPGNYPKSNMLASVYNSLGAIYFRGEKYENAVVSFKNAMNHAPARELKKQIMSNLIKTYTMTGFWDATQSLSRKYVDNFPKADDLGEKQVLIAQAFINLNQYQQAVDYLRKIKKSATSEKEPEIQFYIGDALLKAGRYEDAIAAFVKIPLMSRKTKLQWEASALYYSGQAYEKLGRITDAIRMYEEIINRPGIDLVLKRDAKKRIDQIKS